MPIRDPSPSAPAFLLSAQTHPTPPQTIRRNAGLLMTLALLLLLLAGCGAEQGEKSNSELLSDTEAIAQQYTTGGNLEAARSQLTALPVANANQWLIFAAEERIRAGDNPTAAQALAKLTLDLGLHSSSVNAYAQANGLLSAPVAPTAAPPAGAVFAALPAAQPVAASTPAAQPALSASGATTSTEVIAAASITASVPVTGGTAAEGASTPAAQSSQTVQAVASSIVNLRTGPGTNYDLAGGLAANQPVAVIAKNQAGDWWQVQLQGGQTGWVYGQLVTTTGPAETVAVAANIPTPPPAPTAAPVAQAPPAEAPAPAPETPAEPEPAAPPTPDPNAAPHFTLVERRLWNKPENDGCAGKHLLRIHVLDANGGRLNGVALQGIYTGEIFVTGDQGKGDGIIEFDLYGPGEGFRVIRNNDGRDATSDNAEGFTTRSLDIDVPTLIGAGYCSNDADCQIFYNSFGCTGHHSWEATFKRNY